MKAELALGVFSLTYAFQDIGGASNKSEKLLGGARDENGCLLSAGYTWCDSLSKCLRPWEEKCVDEVDNQDEPVVVTGADRDEHGCIRSAGYRWCEKLKMCARSWELKGEWKENCCVTTKKVVNDVSESSSQDESISDDFLQGLIDGALDEAEKLLGEAMDDTEKLVSFWNETEKHIVGAPDEFGCLPSAGYTWCEALSKCLKVWEEDCEADYQEVDYQEGDYQDYDYQDYDYQDYDYQDEPEVPPGADIDEHGCIGSAGYRWCEKLKICIRPWELEGEWNEHCCVNNKDVPESWSSDENIDSLQDSEDRFDKEKDCDKKKSWLKGKKSKMWCVLGITLVCAITCCFSMVWAKVKHGHAKRSMKIEVITSATGFKEASTCRDGETTTTVKEGEASSGSDCDNMV